MFTCCSFSYLITPCVFMPSISSVQCCCWCLVWLCYFGSLWFPSVLHNGSNIIKLLCFFLFFVHVILCALHYSHHMWYSWGPKKIDFVHCHLCGDNICDPITQGLPGPHNHTHTLTHNFDSSAHILNKAAMAQQLRGDAIVTKQI